MARGLLAIAFSVGCGRIAFDPLAPGDGPGDGSGDGTAGGAALVQSAAAMDIVMNQTVTINPTAAGDLIVVAVTQETAPTTTVTAIADNGPSISDLYSSVNQRSVDAVCFNTAEIWYAPNVHAGVTTVTVSLSAAASAEIWVLEFSGLGEGALDGGAFADDQPTGVILAAPPVTTTIPNAVVVSAAATCTVVSTIATGNPFTALEIMSGEDAAYYIAGAVGAYGATWSYDGGTWNASTAAFR